MTGRCLGWATRALTLVLVALALLVSASSSAPAQAVPGPSAYPEYWFDQWHVRQAWAAGDVGQGITVALLDTGVQADVPGLRGSVLPGADLTGLGGDGRIDRSQDVFSHGTAMASIIVGHDRAVTGIAPKAKILPVALPLIETSHRAPTDDPVATAIRFAVDHGADVISMSFGGPRYRSLDHVACPRRTQLAVYYALRKGAVLVAASGNAAQQGSPVEQPSVCVGVVSVAAVDAHDHPASFSSRHRYLSVAAPGVNVVSLGARNRVFLGSGTSQATALTAGVLALLWSAHPHDTNRQVTTRLFAGLRRPPDTAALGAQRQIYGYGIVDAGRSLAAVASPTAGNPVFDAAAPFLSTAPATTTLAIPPPQPRAALSPTARSRPVAPASLWPCLAAGAGAAAGAGMVAFALLRRRRLPTEATMRAPS